MVAASQAANAAMAYNDMPKVKAGQIDTCCQVQKNIEVMKRELQK
jgi:hypothetical protein